MARQRDLGVQWYMPGRKRPFATSTVASSDLIRFVNEDFPDVTVSRAANAIILDPEAKDILSAYCDAGYGEVRLDDLLNNRVKPRIQKRARA